MAAPDSAAPRRRLDLDWLRIAAFGLLILYHLGLLYGPWPYHAKSRHALPALEPLMLALNPWRLLLLFLVAGVATRMMAVRRPPWRLMAERSLRLLVPLLFGMLVIVPPQAWVQAVEQFGYRGSFPAFYRELYLTGAKTLCDGSRCLALPTWNHLWFLLYLWVYTAALAIGLATLRPVARHLDGLAARALDGVGVLVLPIILLAAARALLLRPDAATGAFLGEGYAHAIYGSAFLIGFAIARQPAPWHTMERARWTALAVAGGALATERLSANASVVLVPVYQWAMVVTLCGFARHHLAACDRPVRRYLTGAILPFYTNARME